MSNVRRLTATAASNVSCGDKRVNQHAITWDFEKLEFITKGDFQLYVWISQREFNLQMSTVSLCGCLVLENFKHHTYNLKHDHAID